MSLFSKVNLCLNITIMRGWTLPFLSMLSPSQVWELSRFPGLCSPLCTVSRVTEAFYLNLERPLAHRGRGLSVTECSLDNSPQEGLPPHINDHDATPQQNKSCPSWKMRCFFVCKSNDNKYDILPKWIYAYITHNFRIIFHNSFQIACQILYLKKYVPFRHFILKITHQSLLFASSEQSANFFFLFFFS